MNRGSEQMTVKPLIKSWASALGILMLISCITVNIYFPEAAVKKTAEDIVNEIRDKEARKEKEKEKEQKIAFTWAPSLFAQAETTVSSPGIRELKESLKRRFPKLVPFFDAGRLGEANDGTVQARDESGLSLADKAALRNLVKDENGDRRALYAEVAKAMAIDAGQVGRVGKIFAEVWSKNARPGWWVQSPEGAWAKKPPEK